MKTNKDQKTPRPGPGIQASRRHQLPDGVEIGQQFLLRFEDPRVEASAYQGRRHQLSRDGLLCFDAPDDVRPRRGTAVTIQSLRSETKSCAFSSEIRGRGRLGGKLPVLLVEPPSPAAAYRRDTYRVNVCLRGRMHWRETPRTEPVESEAVLTNISGGGAQVYLRNRPTSEWVEVTLEVPQSFVEEQSRRHLPRSGTQMKNLSQARNSMEEAGERVRTQFTRLRARAVNVRLHSRDARGPVFAVSLAFSDKQEGCFQLVRYLERQSLRRGVRCDTQQATAEPEPMAVAA